MKLRVLPKWRPAAVIGLFGLAAFVLTGCMKMEANFDIKADDTVDGTIIMAYSDDALEQMAAMSGTTTDDLLSQMDPEQMAGGFTGSMADNTEVEPYSQDGYTGSKITMKGQSLDEMNDGGDPDSLSIVRQGDKFVMSGKLDMSDSDFSSTMDQLRAQSPELAASFEDISFTLTFTFPGPVISSNGQINGNSVTFQGGMGDVIDFAAEAQATGGGGGEAPGAAPEPTKEARDGAEESTTSAAKDDSGLSTPLLIGIIAGAIVLLAVIALVIAMLLKKKQKKAESDPAAYAPPSVPGAPPAAPYGQVDPTQQYPAPSAAPSWPQAAPEATPPVDPTQQFPPPPAAPPVDPTQQFAPPPAAPVDPTQQFPPPPAAPPVDPAQQFPPPPVAPPVDPAQQFPPPPAPPVDPAQQFPPPAAPPVDPAQQFPPPPVDPTQQQFPPPPAAPPAAGPPAGQ
ncbi:MAG: hypothetical protein FWD29_09580 [Micrococcales bacterium]|nr:hypothetical protein [Micrococcales bacterium]